MEKVNTKKTFADIINNLINKKMGTEKTVKFGEVELTYSELKEQMISNGINEKKFVDREPSNLPKVGTFTAFEAAGEKTDEGDFRHYRMIATDAKGKEYKISLSRLQSYGLLKSANQTLKVENLKLSAKNTLYIAGESINPEIPSDQAKAIMELTGRSFKAVKSEIFSLPFGVSYESKEEAIENSGVSTVFKVELT